MQNSDFASLYVTNHTRDTIDNPTNISIIAKKCWEIYKCSLNHPSNIDIDGSVIQTYLKIIVLINNRGY